MKQTKTILLLLSALLISTTLQASALPTVVTLYRQKWLMHSNTNAAPLPLIYRYAVNAATVSPATVEQGISYAPGATNTLTGSTTLFTYATNYAPLVFDGTNIVNGLDYYNRFYPTGNYSIYVAGHVTITPNFPYAGTINSAMTNDFPAVDPALTNVSPVVPLLTTQTFQWPVFTTNTTHFCRFFLLEVGNLSTNVLTSIINNGIEAITNGMTVLSWNLHLAPTANAITVSNINPSMDHLALLEFHHVNPISGTLNIAASVSIGATFFYPLSIVTQPQSQTLWEGESMTMNVLAAGSLPIHYQWKFNEANIANATNLYFTIPQVQFTNAGTYSVVASNASGTKTSDPAVLIVTNAPGPHRLSGPTLLTNGQFRFLLTGDTNGLYDIQTTLNFSGLWDTIGRISTAPLGTNVFLDTNEHILRRFYRSAAVKP